MSTTTANPPVQVVIFAGSAKLQRMLIMDTTSYYSRPDLSRCAASLPASSFR